MNQRLTTIACALGVLVPLAIAAAFISRFAIATPLTDEWLLVYNAMKWHAAAPGTDGLLTALRGMRWLCYTHPVAIPNLIYLALGPLVHFDARPFIFLTLAGNAVILLCGYWRGLRGLPLVVAAVLVFSPARYMEMLWGFQFALGLSVVLGVVGLALLDAAVQAGSRIGLMIAGLAAIVLGALCSAPAAFALPAAIMALMVQQMRYRYLGPLLLLAMAGVLLEFLLFFSPLQVAAGLARGSLFVLTAIGSLALSSPVGIWEFSIDARSVAGAIILALDAFIILKAWRTGTAARLRFGIAMIAFGILATISIALFRPALGNWHLQCAVPLIVGTLWLVGHGLPQPSGLRKVALVVIPLAAVVGYVNAFTVYGPEYRAYAESIRNYMIASARGAQVVKPYPTPFWWDSSAELSLFLRDAGNPDFAVLKTP